MHSVGAEHQRGLDVVVHDERDAVPRAQTARRAPSLDDVHAGDVLEPPLHDRRSTFDGDPRGLELVDDRVQLHEIFARVSSVSGSRAASAS
jgi:hypothetical protein